MAEKKTTKTAKPAKVKLEDLELEIVYQKPADLIPYANNAKLHPDEQVNQIAASIREFGFLAPILIDGENGIVAGHGRLMASFKLKLKKVPTIEISHLTEPQKKAYIIADNKLTMNSDYDMEILGNEMHFLNDLDFDLSLTGFEGDELEELFLNADDLGAMEGEDDVPEPPETPVSKLGDIWQLGDHRLMCGDSTDAGTVALLMDGNKADMVFTDPPYGMSYGGGRARGNHSLDKKTGGVKIKAHGMIKNDDLKGDDLSQLIKESIGHAFTNKKQGGAAYICLTWRSYAEFEWALDCLGVEIKGCIVWNKKSIGLGNSKYRPQHEFIFYIDGQWYGDKSQADVWEMSRGATGEYLHPTQKPIELIEKALLNSSKSGDGIIDLFGGYGSTLIACEKTNRSCFMMELDPHYISVIIERWQNFTGKEAVRSDGKTYSELKK